MLWYHSQINTPPIETLGLAPEAVAPDPHLMAARHDSALILVQIAILVLLVTILGAVVVVAVVVAGQVSSKALSTAFLG